MAATYSQKTLRWVIILSVLAKCQTVCKEGFWHFGHCLTTCPTGYTPEGILCEFRYGEIIDMDFSSKNSSSLKDYLGENKTVAELDSAPIETRSRGLFFRKKSFLEIKKKVILPAIFTMQIWLLLIDHGQILIDSENLTQINADQSHFIVRYNKNILKEVWNKGWIDFYLTFEFLSDKRLFLTFYQNHEKVILNGQENFSAKVLNFTMGSYHKSSFTGFILKTIIFNQISVKFEVIPAPDCEFLLESKCIEIFFIEESYINEETIEECCIIRIKTQRKNNYCIDYKGASNGGYACLQESMLNPDFCYVEYSSVLGLNIIQYYDVPDSGITFPLWLKSSNNIIEGSNPNYSLIGSINTIYAPYRGQYLNGSQYFILSPHLILNSQYFKLSFWIKPEIDNYDLFNQASQNYLKFAETYLEYSFGTKFILDGPFYVFGSWRSICIHFSYRYNSIIYLNGQLNLFSQTIRDIGLLSTFYIGADHRMANRFQGWMHLISYTLGNAYFHSSGFISQNYYNGKEFGSQIYLYDCTYSKYKNETGCFDCPSNCPDCFESEYCQSCFDPNCITCTNYHICSDCGNQYLFQTQCFPECPFMSTSIGYKCNQVNDIIYIFPITENIRKNPSLISFDEAINFPYIPNRGYFIDSSSILKSTQQYFFAYSYQFLVMLNIKDEVSLIRIENIIELFFSVDKIDLLYYNKYSKTINTKNAYNWRTILLKCLFPIPDFRVILNYPINSINIDLSLTAGSGFTKVSTQTYLLNSILILNQFPKKLEITTSNKSSVFVYVMTYSLSDYILDLKDPYFVTNISSIFPLPCNSSTYYESSTNKCINCSYNCKFCINSTDCKAYVYVKLLDIDFPSCPTFFLVKSNECVLDTQISLNFKLDSLLGIITDGRNTSFMTLDTVSKNDWPGFNIQTDPIPGKNRGRYFNNSAEIFLKTSKTLILAPEMFLSVWVNPEFGYFLYKNMLEMGISESSLQINIKNLTNYFSIKTNQSVTMNIWSFFAVSTTYYLNDTYLDVYINRNKEKFFIGSSALMDRDDFLFVGKGNQSHLFKGWVFELKYSVGSRTDAEVLTELGTCLRCECPSSTQECLGDCQPLHYFAFGECKICPESFPCNGPSSMCFSSFCNSCTDYLNCKNCSVASCSSSCYANCDGCLSDSIFACIKCAETKVEFEEVCLDKCPSLYYNSSGKCTGDHFKLDYNFHTLNKFVTDFSNLLTFDGTSSLTGYRRGWYIQNITHTEEIYLSPFIGLTIWVRPFSVSVFLQKSLDGFADLKLSFEAGFVKIELNCIKSKNITQLSVVYSYSWLHIGVSLRKYINSTIVEFFVNGVQKISYQLKGDYFKNSEKSKFYIGDPLAKMWVYSFSIYSELTIVNISNEIIVGVCSKPSSLGECLWDSSLKNYFNGISYLPCDSNCLVCRGPLSCTMCADPFCEVCNDMQAASCLKCFDTFEYNEVICLCPLGYMRKHLTCVPCYNQCNYCTETDPFSCTQCESTSFNFSGICVDPCPVLTIEGAGICTKSTENSIVYDFYTFSRKISDSLGNYHIDNPLNPGIFSYKRGKYFNLLYSEESFAFSPFFSLELFLCPSNFGYLFRTQETSGLSLNLTTSNFLQLNFYNTREEFSSLTFQQLTLNLWTYLLLILEIGSNSTLVKLYRDSKVLVLQQSFNKIYFKVNSKSNFLLGDAANFMWMYKLGYYSYSRSELDIQKELGVCLGCVCPSDLGECLQTCSNNQYSAYCLDCLPHCSSCRYDDSCYYCSDRLCKTCLNTKISTCIECTNNATLADDSTCMCMEGFYQNNSICISCYSFCSVCSNTDPWSCSKCKSGKVRYLNLCFEQCPVLTSESSGNCYNSSQTSLDFNFHIFEDIVSDDSNQYSFSTQQNAPIFGFNRGKMIKKYETDQQLTLSPFFSIVLWIKPLSEGQILEKVSNFIMFSTQNSGLEFSFNNSNSPQITLNLNKDFSSNSWKFLVISFDRSAKISPFNYFENSKSVKFSSSIVSDYLVSIPSKIILGNENSYSWIYQLKYFTITLNTAGVSALIGSCFECFCPISINACLWECDVLSFFRNSCENCMSSCNTCKFNDTCSLCTNSLCNVCKNPNVHSCLNCTEHSHLTLNDCVCDSHYFRRSRYCIECNFYCKECTGEYYKDCNDCHVSINGFCTDRCPVLFFLLEGKCLLLNKNAVVFTFNTLKGSYFSLDRDYEFKSSSGKDYPDNDIGDPTPSYKRGLFFDRSPLETVSDFKFNMNFTIIAWVNIHTFGCFINKERFNISLLEEGIITGIRYQENQSSTFHFSKSIDSKKWIFIAFAMIANGRVEVSIFINSYENIFNDINNYFIDSNEKLILFDTDSIFKGWAYNFIYSSSKFQSNLIYSTTWYKVDLWPCELNFYFEGVCKSCNNCNCRRKNDCSQCQDPLCEICVDYTAECIKCFSYAGFRPGTHVCQVCSPRCSTCVYSVDTCFSCKEDYLMNNDNTCIKYCSDGDFQDTINCLSIKKMLASFIFNTVSNEFTSNNQSLYMGREDRFWPVYDDLDPWILPLRGLYFKRSMSFLGSYTNRSQIRLANSQSFDVFVLILEGRGIILALNNETHPFLVLSAEKIENSLNLVVTYRMTDFLESRFFNISKKVSYKVWVHLTWSLEFSFSTSTLILFVNEPASISKTLSYMVFDQPDYSTLTLGGFKNKDFFNGYIYSLSIFNYKLSSWTDSTKTCNYNFCSSEGYYLINCSPDSYFELGCKKCLSECVLGCSNGENCLLHKDKYCKEFESLTENCRVCIKNTIMNKRPCECIKNGFYDPELAYCVCPEGQLIYEEACDPCFRWLQPGEVKAEFADNFLEVTFRFEVNLVEVPCQEIFLQNDLKKFGENFVCEFSENFKVLRIEFGKGFYLKNETIDINSKSIKGNFQKCGFKLVPLKVKIEYTADLPVPKAIILTKEKVFMKCENMEVDGILSTGQLIDGLMYKWLLNGILSKYSKEFSSMPQLIIEKDLLVKGNYSVSLTVKNKFDQLNTTSIDIEIIDIDTLAVFFDPLIDYSCPVSKSCIFDIQEIQSCIENPVIELKWEFTQGFKQLTSSGLQKFWSNQTIPTAIKIPQNIFKPSWLTFTLKISEMTKKLSISKILKIKVKAEAPEIMISRSPGSVSSLEDLIINATIPVDSTTSIYYQWLCFYLEKLCSFELNSTNPVLFIPLNITSQKIIDNLILNVTTTQIIGRRLQENATLSSSLSFACKFVDWVVPTVKIFEVETGRQPKVFSSLRVTKLRAQIAGEGTYSVRWTLGNLSIFVSGNTYVDIGIQPWQLTKGSLYKLKLEVKDVNNNINEFDYEFTINSPPKFGIFSVNPKEGIELETEFRFYASDWVDAENNYPLSYSYGVFNQGKITILISKTLKSYTGNMKLPYYNSEVILLSQIFDSLEDFTEVRTNITLHIKENIDIIEIVQNLNSSLSTTLVPNLPSS